MKTLILSVFSGSSQCSTLQRTSANRFTTPDDLPRLTPLASSVVKSLNSQHPSQSEQLSQQNQEAPHKVSESEKVTDIGRSVDVEETIVIRSNFLAFEFPATRVIRAHLSHMCRLVFCTFAENPVPEI